MAKHRSVYYHPAAWSSEGAVEVARLYEADNKIVGVQIIDEAGCDLTREHRACILLGQEDLVDWKEFEELPISVGPHFRLGPTMRLE